MKGILALLFALIATTSAFSQTGDDYIEVARDILNTEKKAAVAEAMMLTEDVSGKFWEMYNEYQAKLYPIHTKRVNLIKDYAASYENMTDEKADELWTAALAYEQEALNLQKSYYKKFKKELGAGIAAKYFQVENKIENLIDAELAMDIPVMDIK